MIKQSNLEYGRVKAKKDFEERITIVITINIVSSE